MNTTQLSRLKAEQRRIKAEYIKQEIVLDQKFDHITDNAGSIVLSSILPKSVSQNDPLNKAMDKVSNFVLKMVPGEDKEQKYGPIIKSVQLIGAGLLARYLKKLF
jgi:hypothetical protein